MFKAFGSDANAANQIGQAGRVYQLCKKREHQDNTEKIAQIPMQIGPFVQLLSA
jgi:hypothetical protein